MNFEVVLVVEKYGNTFQGIFTLPDIFSSLIKYTICLDLNIYTKKKQIVMYDNSTVITTLLLNFL